ncbi:MAG: hypothetical protein GKS01_13605 [Alphaproteobacteria bacterium]|nr:hypothetical protein [Alphaproteobacteria bacterium]
MDGLYSIDGLAGGTVSNELQATLQAISETSDGAQVKFKPTVCRRLTRWIVCRSYTGPIHELCHLIHIVSQIENFENFFWGAGPATAGAFRRKISDGLFHNPAAAIEQHPSTVQANYFDGDFAIAHTRMPFLSALLEFLVSTLGYDVVLETIPEITVSTTTKAQISKAANTLSRRLYAYLNTHLPAATAQRKYRAVTEFMASCGNGAARADDINDDMVLNFWIEASTDEDGDFKTFRKVVRLFVNVRDALSAAQQQGSLHHSLSIGSDRENGEIDPGSIDIALEEIHERRAPLDQLDVSPANQIKFLNKNERNALELLIESGHTAEILPLSILRAEVFGDIQAKLTQAFRRGTSAATAIDANANQVINAGYELSAKDIEKIGANLERAVLASFYHLAMAGDDAAISILLEIRPDIDLSPLAKIISAQEGTADNVVYLHAIEDRSPALSTVLNDRATCPALAEFVAKSKKAASRISRKGFAKPEIGSSEIEIAGFASAAEALINLHKSLSRFIALLPQIAESHGGWDALDENDRAVFFNQFRQLYGVCS